MQLAHSFSSIKLYETCPLRYYRQRILKDVTDEGSDASVHGERIHKFLEDRLRENASLPAEAARYEPLCQMVEKLAEGGQLYVEQELVLNENLEPTGWWDSDAWLRSKLDVLIITADGREAVVMDWKTGKRRADFFQMQMFAAQVMKHFPEVQRVRAILVWLKTLEQDTEVYSRDKINEAWAEIMTRIRRIHRSYEQASWPARPGPLCRYCPARGDCEFFV